MRGGVASLITRLDFLLTDSAIHKYHHDWWTINLKKKISYKNIKSITKLYVGIKNIKLNNKTLLAKKIKNPKQNFMLAIKI